MVVHRDSDSDGDNKTEIKNTLNPEYHANTACACQHEHISSCISYWTLEIKPEAVLQQTRQSASTAFCNPSLWSGFQIGQQQMHPPKFLLCTWATLMEHDLRTGWQWWLTKMSVSKKMYHRSRHKQQLAVQQSAPQLKCLMCFPASQRSYYAWAAAVRTTISAMMNGLVRTALFYCFYFTLSYSITLFYYITWHYIYTIFCIYLFVFIFTFIIVCYLWHILFHHFIYVICLPAATQFLCMKSMDVALHFCPLQAYASWSHTHDT